MDVIRLISSLSVINLSKTLSGIFTTQCTVVNHYLKVLEKYIVFIAGMGIATMEAV
jgi:hypothetical protein